MIITILSKYLYGQLISVSFNLTLYHEVNYHENQPTKHYIFKLYAILQNRLESMTLQFANASLNYLQSCHLRISIK